MDGTRGRFGGTAEGFGGLGQGQRGEGQGERGKGRGERGKGRGVGHTTAETGTCQWIASEVGWGPQVTAGRGIYRFMAPGVGLGPEVGLWGQRCVWGWVKGVAGEWRKSSKRRGT